MTLFFYDFSSNCSYSIQFNNLKATHQPLKPKPEAKKMFLVKFLVESMKNSWDNSYRNLLITLVVCDGIAQKGVKGCSFA